LIASTNAVLVECRGYALLGEFEPLKESLKQFRNFIQTNGLDKKDTLLKLLQRLKKDYPHARIVGHRDLPYVVKDCPCFDAGAEYATIACD
jgi:hypothetical protein